MQIVSFEKQLPKSFSTAFDYSDFFSMDFSWLEL